MTRTELNRFIETVLLNKNGKLEGQRLTSGWFIKHGYKEEYNFFHKNDIHDAKSLYNYVNGEEFCECKSHKRFKGYRDGYVAHCEHCSRTKYNHMKHQGTIDIELDNLIEHIKCNNKYSSARIKGLSSSTLSNITERTKYLDESVSISERLYHIEHNIYSCVLCKKCNKSNNNFRTGTVGYHPYCTRGCSYSNDKIQSARLRGIKAKFYQHFLNKFKNKDYDVIMFTEDDYINSLECVVTFTHKKCRHVYSRDIYYQGHLKCPMCYPIRSRVQYEIYDLFNKDDMLFNDRKLLKPKEIDMLNHEHKFGIEYDGLMWHSYGMNKSTKFNNYKEEDSNCHLYKTELMEDKGYRLYRIFSNEYKNKQKIWESIINDKLGLNIEVTGIVKEVSTTEYQEFCKLNHLESYSTADKVLGVLGVHNNELLGLMAFRGKELVRYCSKNGYRIDYSIILKEMGTFSTGISSSLNRRFDDGSELEKIGFRIIGYSEPDSFYFRGDDSSELEFYGSYEEGYRKIYDCGRVLMQY